jgi:hypothetical protein
MKQPTTHEMVERERREVRIALNHLAGDSIDAEALYFRGAHGKSIMTYAGAIDLASLLKIERLGFTTKQIGQSNGMPATVATVTTRCNNSIRVGAAVSKNPLAAVELAFRNSVKHHAE